MSSNQEDMKEKIEKKRWIYAVGQDIKSKADHMIEGMKVREKNKKHYEFIKKNEGNKININDTLYIHCHGTEAGCDLHLMKEEDLKNDAIPKEKIPMVVFDNNLRAIKLFVSNKNGMIIEANIDENIRKNLDYFIELYHKKKEGYSFLKLQDMEDVCDLCLMSEFPDDGKPERGKMYLEKQGKQLKYIVIDPGEETVEDLLDINVEDFLTKKFLNSKKSDILDITSERGHTRKNPLSGVILKWLLEEAHHHLREEENHQRMWIDKNPSKRTTEKATPQDFADWLEEKGLLTEKVRSLKIFACHSDKFAEKLYLCLKEKFPNLSVYGYQDEVVVLKGKIVVSWQA